MNSEMNFRYKRDSFNVIPKILYEKIMNNFTIKASSYPRIVDPVILKLCPEGNYEPLTVCNKYVIKFGTGKII